MQALQKRLIAKTEEVVEKNLAIQEKEKLFCELKQVLARQPGPEVIEQISVYKVNTQSRNTSFLYSLILDNIKRENKAIESNGSGT